jgi:NAD(P)-dependent dehydrogenase (short-subunit alcohol dehydrogenase family)
MGKLERCRSQVESLTGSSQVFVECADLSCLEQTRALAERIHARNWPLHRLINNAGVLLPKREATASGLERSTVINLVSHYLLTELLLPRLRATESSGVINVSSGGMYTQRLDLNMLKGHGGYDGVVSYAQTKRAQVILTERWADNPLNDKVWFGCMHPGWVDTPGVAFSLPTFYTLTKPLLRSPDQGADTIVWLSSAIESGLPNGRFWHDRKVRPTHRRKATVEQATDRDELVRWLDSLTEKFPTPPLTDAPVSFPCAESGQGR